MKYRVKQDVRKGRFYPQIRILGLWLYFSYDNSIIIAKTKNAYYTDSVETSWACVNVHKHHKGTNGTTYEYLPNMLGFRLKKVTKNGNIKYHAQKRFIFIWYRFGRNNDINYERHVHYSAQSGWDYIIRLDTLFKTPKPKKVLYHYPEKTRKEKIKSLKV